MPRLIGYAVLSRFISQRLVFCMARLRQADLTILQGLLQAGKVSPFIDRRYPLSQVPEAIRYLETGHARVKVVILPSDNNKPGPSATGQPQPNP